MGNDEIREDLDIFAIKDESESEREMMPREII
jgi:hypothetical protein